MKTRFFFVLSAALCAALGCSRDNHSSEVSRNKELIPFMVTNGLDHHFGFRDGKRKIVLPAQYLNSDSFFCEGFAWVDTDYCNHPLDGIAEMPKRGTFVDFTGRQLPLSHVHSVHEISDCDLVWKPPRFNHGLAFVRLEDGTICGLTTNGTPLDVHAEFGMFADHTTNPLVDDAWYWHYRGDWALVGLADGRVGILDENRRFAVGPTNDAEFVKLQWSNDLSSRDPFVFPDVAVCRWLDFEIEVEGPMLLPLGKLCDFLRHDFQTTSPDLRLDIDCRYGDYTSGILVAGSPKTVRNLLKEVLRDNWVYPMISLSGVYFIANDGSTRLWRTKKELVR